MRSSAELACVAPDMVEKAWPLARWLVALALKRGGSKDFERVEREVLAGLQLLWLAHADGAIEAVAVTQLVSEANRKICMIVACGGKDRERWLPLLARLEDYAKAEGCKAMQISGRPGWQRELDGYRVKCVLMEKDLT